MDSEIRKRAEARADECVAAFQKWRSANPTAGPVEIWIESWCQSSTKASTEVFALCNQAMDDVFKGATDGK